MMDGRTNAKLHGCWLESLGAGWSAVPWIAVCLSHCVVGWMDGWLVEPFSGWLVG